MKIIVLGSNRVSLTLAENLVSENHDITLIDTNAEKLKEIQNRCDLQTVVGHGSFPDVLEKANANDTDMLIAVSGQDEVNMLACQVAYSLFKIPMKIARIRTPNYLTHNSLFCDENLPVDVIISPEQLVTNTIKRLIEYPGVLQVLEFAEGKVQLVAMKPHYGGKLVGKPLSVLRSEMKKHNASIAAVFRGNQALSLKDDIVVDVGDEVFFVANKTDIKANIALLRRLDYPNRNIMIAGGGHIGSRLAAALEDEFHVKLLELNSEIAQQNSIKLDSTVVLHGNASDKELLLQENIDQIDVFCALTNDDEANIMSCLQAKRLGAKHVMALVANTAYIDIVEGGTIDIVISPQVTTISSILAYIRQGDIVNVHSLRRGAAEALEVVAHGDQKTSRVVGKQMSDINLPRDVHIGAIVRNGRMLIPKEDTCIEPEDHVILFLANKNCIREVEKLFQVKVSFF